MDAAVLDATVIGYEHLIPALTDPDDRHVLAAAIRCGASAIVTFNTKDFPDAELAKYGVHTRHPDQFIRDVDGLSSGAVVRAAKDDRLHYPLSVDEYIEGIETAGLPMVANEQRAGAAGVVSRHNLACWCAPEPCHGGCWAGERATHKSLRTHCGHLPGSHLRGCMGVSEQPHHNLLLHRHYFSG